LNLFNKYLLLVTFETDDNYSVRFEMKNTIRTALPSGLEFHNGNAEKWDKSLK